MTRGEGKPFQGCQQGVRLNPILKVHGTDSSVMLLWVLPEVKLRCNTGVWTDSQNKAIYFLLQKEQTLGLASSLRSKYAKYMDFRIW